VVNVAKSSTAFEEQTNLQDGPPAPAGLPPSASLPPAAITVPMEFFSQLIQTLSSSMKQLVEEIRKPPHDPIKEAQMERARKTKEQAEKFYWEALSERAMNCTHGREDMTSAIAWAQQSDGKIRGTCQHCQTVFSPVREECCSQEVFDRYKELRRIPTQRGSGVLYINS
jgi:hypothetical protein